MKKKATMTLSRNMHGEVQRHGGLISKLRQSEAFTLIEMLIVVAIIAVLVAISIPMPDDALERARNAANERAAKAALFAAWYGGEKIIMADSTEAEFKVGTTFAYDAKTGRLVRKIAGMTAYGKSMRTDVAVNYRNGNAEGTGGEKPKIILIGVGQADGEIHMLWVYPGDVGDCDSINNASYNFYRGDCPFTQFLNSGTKPAVADPKPTFMRYDDSNGMITSPGGEGDPEPD